MTVLADKVDTALDYATHIAQSPLMKLIGWLYPDAKPIIEIAKKYAPAIQAAQPDIVKAVEAGQPAFEAAVKAAPAVAKAVAEIVHHLPPPAKVVNGKPTPQQSAMVVENVTRILAGQRTATQEEEKAWMDRFTPDPNIG